ncbi:MAG: cytochrome family protein [Acidobacteriaceae bacterium]|nr:cytochrome family protein [Acidobacteriaceae bacterium]
MPSRPPGPKPRFLIGNMPLASSDPLLVFTAWAREFGDIFYYRAAWLHVYFLNHPDLIEEVLVRNYKNVLKDRVVRNSRWFFGQGLLTNEGDSWLRQRRLSQPAFHRERVASYAKIMTDYAGQVLATWQDGEIRDIHQEMMRLTLRIVVRTLFNVESEETEQISSAMNIVMGNTTGIRMLLPPIARYLPTPKMIGFRRAVARLDETVYSIVSKRRAHERVHTEDSGDLLSMLMQAKDEDGSRMSDKQLRDEVLTFLLAGHETTALALSWTWHLLGQHSEVERKLHQELDRVLDGRVPIFSDLPALTYTERVIKESMRLYPPAWSLARTVVSDFELRGYRIPSGANVVMSQWIMHRNPTYFPDPDKFDPDRWLPERSQKLPRFAYFPFGGGARQCIGTAFAMMEATILLATIAQRFRFNTVPEHPVVPIPSFTLRPKYGIKMTIQTRQRSAAHAPINDLEMMRAADHSV